MIKLVPTAVVGFLLGVLKFVVKGRNSLTYDASRPMNQIIVEHGSPLLHNQLGTYDLNIRAAAAGVCAQRSVSYPPCCKHG
jgi:hypothetical protein